MRVSVEDLIVQAELDASYNRGFDEGKLEGKDEVIFNMLSKSVDDVIICEYVGCDLSHVNKLKNTSK